MQVVPPEEEEVSLTFQLWQLFDPVQSIWKKHDHILPPLWSESVGQTPLNFVGTILTNTTVWAPRNSHNPYWPLLYNLVSNEITRIDFPGSEPLNGRKVWPCLDYAENLDIPWLESDADEKEHKRLLARNSIIEKRKEDQERQQLEMESEEGQKRLKLQKLNKEAEQKRLAAELEERRKQRILREIEERELEEAQALLEGTEKRMKKGKKKPLLDGEKVTKQYVMERALTEQVKERQEMERKLQKLAKTMDYLERAKREEAAPLIEAAYQRRLVEEREFYEREQQREVELSKERHESDLKEKNRLSRMLDNKDIFQAQVISHRQAEFDRIRAEKEERISQVIQARKQEREIKRKQIYYLTCEEERIAKLREYE